MRYDEEYGWVDNITALVQLALNWLGCWLLLVFMQRLGLIADFTFSNVWLLFLVRFLIFASSNHHFIDKKRSLDNDGYLE
jgi:membrane-anchored protein YejM (alkaline phosphatase superfamily)